MNEAYASAPLAIGVTSHRNIAAHEEAGVRERVRKIGRASCRERV